MKKSPITLHLAQTTEEKRLAGAFVEAHHSYVASSRVVGRCLKYLAYNNTTLIGTIWMGSGFKPTPKDLLRHLGLKQADFDGVFNQLADNKRFCLHNAPKNAGSQVLRIMRERIKTDWAHRYGDDLKWLVTTVGGGKRGSVYLADNWRIIGRTAGLPAKRKSVSMAWDSAETLASRFVKPTGENRKTILFTDRVK